MQVLPASVHLPALSSDNFMWEHSHRLTVYVCNMMNGFVCSLRGVLMAHCVRLRV